MIISKQMGVGVWSHFDDRKKAWSSFFYLIVFHGAFIQQHPTHSVVEIDKHPTLTKNSVVDPPYKVGLIRLQGSKIDPSKIASFRNFFMS